MCDVARKVKEVATPYVPHSPPAAFKHVRMGDRGRVVIPAEVRERASLKPGDRLVFVVDDDGWVKMTTWSNAVDNMVGMFADVAPGRSWVDELIAERRAEAARE
jgi:AbrB family looped-hinge helix DNA binding protein